MGHDGNNIPCANFDQKNITIKCKCKIKQSNQYEDIKDVFTVEIRCQNTIKYATILDEA